MPRRARQPLERRRAPLRRKPQARGVATRQRLLDIARALFSREGYPAVSRADVAREAGCGMSTAYYHFPSKRSMLLELIDQWGRSMPVQRRAAFDVQIAIGGDLRRAAHDFLRRSYRDMQKGSSFYRVILAEAERDPEVRRRYEAARQAITTWIADMARVGQSSGAVRTGRRPEAAGFLLHHVIESTLAEVAAQSFDSEFREEILAELGEMICCFLLSDASDAAERPTA